MAVDIDEWWPLLNEQIRFWIVNNVFFPLSPYTLEEIQRVRGPGSDDPYWKREFDGERSLPSDAIQWITPLR